MEHTKNFGLKKPGKTEFYNVNDFNENMDILDTKLKELEESSTSGSDNITIFKDVAVETSAWTNDSIYEAFPWQAQIPCEGINTDYVADVNFDVVEATSGIYAPICITGDGIVTIFATEIPSDTIVIPVIKCVKAVV